jgi:hypothetical protein
MNPRVVVLAAAALLAQAAPAAHAAATPAARAEIEHLLDHLTASSCEFWRNGNWHDAVAARKHIDRKHAWLERRGLADTAELFIERAASKSERSGKPYRVRCGQATVDAASWFTLELERWRAR